MRNLETMLSAAPSFSQSPKLKLKALLARPRLDGILGTFTTNTPGKQLALVFLLLFFFLCVFSNYPVLPFHTVQLSRCCAPVFCEAFTPGENLLLGLSDPHPFPTFSFSCSIMQHGFFKVQTACPPSLPPPPHPSRDLSFNRDSSSCTSSHNNTTHSGLPFHSLLRLLCPPVSLLKRFFTEPAVLSPRFRTQTKYTRTVHLTAVERKLGLGKREGRGWDMSDPTRHSFV